MKFNKTLGICDRCGFEWKWKQLKKQVVARRTTTLMVCPPCMDEDQPQWFPARIVSGDPAPVPDARPLQDEELSISGFGWGPVGGMDVFLTMGIMYDFDLEDRPITSYLGGDIIIQEDGFAILQEDGFTILVESA